MCYAFTRWSLLEFPELGLYLSNFLLNSFWINCSLPVACFLSFQTFLSNVLSRFHLLRDVNLSVCPKWWLTFDTENPVIFVTSQASNVLRLDSLIVALGFSGASCIYLTSLVEFKLHDGNLSACMNRWFTVDTDNLFFFDFQLFCSGLSMVHVVFELILYSCSMSCWISFGWCFH